jgi:hypothetical protein
VAGDNGIRYGRVWIGQAGFGFVRFGMVEFVMAWRCPAWYSGHDPLFGLMILLYGGVR